MKDVFQRCELVLSCESAHRDLLIGNQTFDAGEFAAAHTAYADAHDHLAVYPSSEPLEIARAELQGLMADCRANLGAFDQAIAIIDAALESLKTVADATCQLTQETLVLRDRRAFYLAWTGRCDLAAIESQAVVIAQRTLNTQASSSSSAELSRSGDLSRSLDHQAEILERARRLPEALQAATDSTNLRRDLAKSSPHFIVPFLRSLVTQARLIGAMGNPLDAVKKCEEGLASLSGLGQLFPLDLEAQYWVCHGRNLAELGQRDEAAISLRKSATCFRALAHETKAPSLFTDALAHVLLDLGRLYLDNAPTIAHGHFIRACALKRRLVDCNPHPAHRAGYAEALLWLACSNVSRAEWDVDAVMAAVAPFYEQDFLPPSFPTTALTLSRFLLSHADDHALGEFFWRLSVLVLRSIDTADDGFMEEMEPIVDEYQALWLAHFIAHKDATSLIAWMTLAHGHRLATLALAERKTVTITSGSVELRRLSELRGKICRLDLEMDDILNARNPSIVQREGPSKGAAEKAVKSAGMTLTAERDLLFHEFVALRDKLVERGDYPAPTSHFQHPNALLALIQRTGNAVAIWCVPSVFGVSHDPCLVLVPPNNEKPCLTVVPEIFTISMQVKSLILRLGAGRSGIRGSSLPAYVARSGLESLEAIERLCWQQMDLLWKNICAPLGTDATRLDLVTHGTAHNLPWLGSCPENIHLRQFPSLNFLIARDQSPVPPRPSADHPLILQYESPAASDPFAALYHADLEAEIVRHIWKNAVVDVTNSAKYADFAGLWIIGHGLTDARGQPMLGRSGELGHLAETAPLRARHAQMGLMYASTCFLGHTSDTDNEPVGLSSLAAARHDAPFAAGAIAPVDDLGATLLALFFHVYWRGGADPRSAFDHARRSLLEGNWPDAAITIFKEVCREHLPAMLARAANHARFSSSQVAHDYPDLNASERLARQYAIRKHGRACVRLWSTKFSSPTTDQQVGVLMVRLGQSSNSQLNTKQVKATAKLWAWFG